MRTGILSSVLCLVSLPGAIAVTLLLHPFWSWIEAHLGIEAVGHSGPSAWCYIAVYVIMAITSVAALLIFRQRS